ncbi:MAG: hypothetical protein AAB601_03575 [Patescibacteria group bacterium]|mgnify:FL=1
MKKHYLCTGGCGGVLDRPGVCGAPECPAHGQPLEECDCTDDRHYGAFDITDGSEEKSGEET